MEHIGVDSSITTLAELAANWLDGRTLACAESFTAGLICQAMASVESSADWFRGGVVAYQSSIKQDLLGVSPGPVVDEHAAQEMAIGVSRLMRADVAVSTTGVGGPSTQDGVPPGVVVIGWCIGTTTGATTMRIPGDPSTVIERGARAAVVQLTAALTGDG